MVGILSELCNYDISENFLEAYEELTSRMLLAYAITMDNGGAVLKFVYYPSLIAYVMCSRILRARIVKILYINMTYKLIFFC